MASVNLEDAEAELAEIISGLRAGEHTRDPEIYTVIGAAMATR